MYDAQYAAVTTVEAFKEELAKKKNKPVRIIEVFTNRQINVQAHRAYVATNYERLDENE